MKTIWQTGILFMVLAVAAGCRSTTPLADGWFECEKCKAMITSRNGEIMFQISTQESDDCVHKWNESEGADIDPIDPLP